MIEIIELSKIIGDKHILNKINLTVEKGEVISILGSNGAGKTTLLKILAGLMKPSSGEISINGLLLQKEDNKIKQIIGYLAHQSFLYEHFTPLENLLFFAELYQVNDMEKRIKKLIDDVGLSLFMYDPIRSFSRGMIQRLAIARAILHSPSILLLDEPHTGLDQEGIELLNSIITQMKEKEVTTILVTHDFHQALQLSDRFVILKHGEIVDYFLNKEEFFGWMDNQHRKMGFSL